MTFPYIFRSLCGVEIPKYVSSFASSRGFVSNPKINHTSTANFSLACCKRGKKHLMAQGLFSKSHNLNVSSKSRYCTRSTTSAYSLGIKRQSSPMYYNETQNFLCPCKRNFPLWNSIYVFHTTPVRMVPPLIFMIAKTAAKMLAIITGRGFRKWWGNLPSNKKSYFSGIMRNNMGKLIAVMIGSSLIFLVYYESHLQEAPFTKRKRYIAFTDSQFEQIASFEFKLQLELFKDQFLPTTHPHYAQVSRVAQRLLKPIADLECVKNKTFSIAVLRNSEENAFVLPQGQIFIFEGILGACQTDDQLAVIMAHEISHCILGHAAENISFAHLLDFVVIAFLAAIWAILPTDGIAIVTQWFFHKVVNIWLHLPYSRKLETEADEVGLQLAAKACFDVRETSAFWARMSIKNEEAENLEWLSTHPSNSKRSAHLDSLMEKALELRKQNGCTDLSIEHDPRKFVEMIRMRLEARQPIIDPENLFVHVVPKS